MENKFYYKFFDWNIKQLLAHSLQNETFWEEIRM